MHSPGKPKDLNVEPKIRLGCSPQFVPYRRRLTVKDNVEMIACGITDVQGGVVPEVQPAID